MRKWLTTGTAAVASLLAIVVVGTRLSGNQAAAGSRAGAPPQAARGGGQRGGAPGSDVAPGLVSIPDENFLRMPLAPADRAYAAIDGKHLKTHVQELTALSRRYRDAGHQFCAP